MDDIENIQDQAIDKRENQRIDLEIEVKIKSPEKKTLIIGWMKDVSDGGLKFKTDAPLNFKLYFNEGDEISFETFEDFLRFKGKGKIRWTSNEKNEIGIKFDELDNSSKQFLDSFLRLFS